MESIFHTNIKKVLIPALEPYGYTFIQIDDECVQFNSSQCHILIYPSEYSLTFSLCNPKSGKCHPYLELIKNLTVNQKQKEIEILNDLPEKNIGWSDNEIISEEQISILLKQLLYVFPDLVIEGNFSSYNEINTTNYQSESDIDFDQIRFDI